MKNSLDSYFRIIIIINPQHTWRKRSTNNTTKNNCVLSPAGYKHLKKYNKTTKCSITDNQLSASLMNQVSFVGCRAKQECEVYCTFYHILISYKKYVIAMADGWPAWNEIFENKTGNFRFLATGKKKKQNWQFKNCQTGIRFHLVKMSSLQS